MKKAPEPLEASIQRAIYDAMRWHGNVAFIDRINVVAGQLTRRGGGKSMFLRSAKKGHADLEGFSTTGKFIAIEVKRPSTRNDLSPDQRHYLSLIQTCGGLAGVATSVDEAMDIVEGRGIRVESIS